MLGNGGVQSITTPTRRVRFGGTGGRTGVHVGQGHVEQRYSSYAGHASHVRKRPILKAGEDLRGVRPFRGLLVQAPFR